MSCSSSSFSSSSSSLSSPSGSPRNDPHTSTTTSSSNERPSACVGCLEPLEASVVSLAHHETSNQTTTVPTALSINRETQQSSEHHNREQIKPSDWKLQMIEAAIKDIEHSEFVAIDLEFSGLFRAPMRQHVLEKHFKECVESAKDFMTLQLGVCPVWRASSDPDYQHEDTNPSPDRNGSTGQDVWRMAPYNFHVFPTDRKVFSSDTTTLSWLLENGFSFDKWIQNGFDYARLVVLQNSTRHLWRRSLEKVKTEGLQRVIAAIIENEKPVVMHNGLFDILHTYHKFIDELPSNIIAFCNEWLRIFTGGIYDTKHIATEGLYSVFHLGGERRKCRSHLSLAPRFYKAKQAVKSIANSPGTNSSPKNVEDKPPPDSSDLATSSVPPSEASNFDNTRTSPIRITGMYSLVPVPTGHADSKCHEAGYDAMITAQVFLMECELYHRTTRIKKSSSIPVSTASDTAIEASTAELKRPYIPRNWRTSECFGKRFTNVIELVKVAPGKIDLRVIASSFRPSANQVWKRTAPAPATSNEQPCGILCKTNTSGTGITNKVLGTSTEESAQITGGSGTASAFENSVIAAKLSTTIENGEQSAERPRKKRRTEETEPTQLSASLSDEEVEIIDTEQSSDETTSRGQSPLSASSDSSDPEVEGRSEKEQLLFQRVQRLRETRRLKAKRLLEETEAKLERQRISVKSSSNDYESSAALQQAARRRALKEEYSSQSPYPFAVQPSESSRVVALQKQIAHQSRVATAQSHRTTSQSHRTTAPTATWAVPLRVGGYMSAAANTAPRGNCTVTGSTVPYGHPTGPPSTSFSRRYFTSQHQLHRSQLPYDSAIVAASFHPNRVLDLTKSAVDHQANHE